MNQIKEVLSRQMTRQQFLQTVGIGALALFGVSNFISYFSKHDRQTHTVGLEKAHTSQGFGSRTFGS